MNWTSVNSTVIRKRAGSLKREEWDLSNLPAAELIPAVLWETRREYGDLVEIIKTTQAWLDGKLSEKKLAMPKDKRTGKRRRHNTNSSEADKARIQAAAAFGEFIPYHEFRWLHNGSVKHRRAEYNRWLASQIAPLVQYCNIPWLCLPETERQRFSKAYNSSVTARVVTIGSWWDAIATFKQDKPDRGLPLKFNFSDYTSVLFTINWRYSQKRILAEIAELLKQMAPVGIKRWDSRGKKDRDVLVMLERLAVMRLLHHYTLAEVKRLLPDAWNLYQNRKWYDDRRRALKDFRSIIGHQDQNFFPVSWKTKAQQSKKS